RRPEAARSRVGPSAGALAVSTAVGPLAPTGGRPAPKVRRARRRPPAAGSSESSHTLRVTNRRAGAVPPLTTRGRWASARRAASWLLTADPRAGEVAETTRATGASGWAAWMSRASEPASASTAPGEAAEASSAVTQVLQASAALTADPGRAPPSGN